MSLAERQDFEIIAGAAATYNLVHFSPEVAILSYDAKSIIQSTHKNKLFDNWTGHTVGVVKVVGGKRSWNGFYKNMAPDGEFIIGESYGDSESGTTYKPLYGTGKWKGAKSEAKGKRITSGKPIIEGTDQFCEKITGWIELPK
jgi:hypothetical protein